MKYKILLIIILFLSIKSFAYRELFTYSERVNFINDELNVDGVFSNLLSIRDSVNEYRIEYNCDDTLYSESCIKDRVTYFDDIGRLISDTVFTTPQVITVRTIKYYPDCSVIKMHKTHTSEDVQIDSLIFTDKSKLKFWYKNGKLKKEYSYEYDNTGRLIRSVSKKKMSKTVYEIKYTIDSIIETETNTSYYGTESINKNVSIYNDLKKIKEHYRTKSYKKYATINGEIIKDSVLSTRKDLHTNKEIYYYPTTDSIIETFTKNSKRNIYVYNNEKLTEYIQVPDESRENSIHIRSVFILDKETKKTFIYYNDLLRSSHILLRDNSGKTINRISRSVDDSGNEYLFEKYYFDKKNNQTISYRIVRGKLTSCNVKKWNKR